MKARIGLAARSARSQTCGHERLGYCGARGLVHSSIARVLSRVRLLCCACLLFFYFCALEGARRLVDADRGHGVGVVRRKRGKGHAYKNRKWRQQVAADEQKRQEAAEAESKEKGATFCSPKFPNSEERGMQPRMHEIWGEARPPIQKGEESPACARPVLCITPGTLIGLPYVPTLGRTAGQRSRNP